MLERMKQHCLRCFRESVASKFISPALPMPNNSATPTTIFVCLCSIGNDFSVIANDPGAKPMQFCVTAASPLQTN
jgi:hypothetical protein